MPQNLLSHAPKPALTCLLATHPAWTAATLSRSNCMLTSACYVAVGELTDSGRGPGMISSGMGAGFCGKADSTAVMLSVSSQRQAKRNLRLPLLGDVHRLNETVTTACPTLIDICSSIQPTTSSWLRQVYINQPDYQTLKPWQHAV